MSKEIGELSVKKELRIGVVIPSYIRHIPLLKRCLDSIETQTKPPNIVSISCSSSKKDSVNLTSYSFPIKINYTEEVQNAAQNRNYAASIILEEVDVLLFMDCDDEMYPRYVEFIERAFLETNYDFIVHGFVLFLSLEDDTLPTIIEYNAYQDVLIANPDPHGGVILKREFDPTGDMSIANGHLSVRSEIFNKEQYGIDFYLWEDGEYNKRLINRGYKGVYLSTQLSKYNQY